MNKLSLILGGIALGAVGYGLKKWYDQTKEENAYWTDDHWILLEKWRKKAQIG